MKTERIVLAKDFSIKNFIKEKYQNLFENTQKNRLQKVFQKKVTETTDDWINQIGMNNQNKLQFSTRFD